MKQKKILVMGSANLDFVVRVNKMPAVGETLLCKSFERLPGGKGANQAYACGLLGGDVAFLGAVGKDGLGELLVDNLKKAGVNCTGVVFREEMSTGLAVIYVDDEGNNSIVVIPGANSSCFMNDLEKAEALLKEAGIVMAQLEIPQDEVYAVMKKAHEAGKFTILNPAPAPEAIPDWVYPTLHLITPNETELKKLTGMPVDTVDEAQQAARLLLKKGVKNVIATLGGRGALLVNRQGESLFAPPSVPVIDTTAAGDTFSGALAVKLAQGEALESAVIFANGAAALAVSRKGAQASVPTLQETEAFLQLQGKGGV